jgi:hypothetical protein
MTYKLNLRALIEEFIRHETDAEYSRRQRKEFGFSGFVSAGDGRQVALSGKMEKAIEGIAISLREQDNSLLISHTEKEWISIVRNACGPALGCVDLQTDVETNVQAVAKSLNDKIGRARLALDLEFTFGCTLFEDKVDAFEIGPVTFEPRSSWLQRNVATGLISKVTARRLALTWSGKKPRKRLASLHADYEEFLTDTIAEHLYVCTVKLRGPNTKAVKQRAIKAAHIAFVAIALTWITPSSGLEAFHLSVDAGPRRMSHFVISENSFLSATRGFKGLPSAKSVFKNDWANTLSDYTPIFDVVGRAISLFLNPMESTKQPKITGALIQSLLLLYEACCDEFDLLAIVKFVSALDTLADGRGAEGILQLLNKRLVIKNSDSINEKGMTLEEAVAELYRDGRNRIVHGGSRKLLHDWERARKRAEELSRHCIVACIDWAAKNPLNDSLRALRN